MAGSEPTVLGASPIAAPLPGTSTSVLLGARSLRVGGRDVPMRLAAMHYVHVPPRSWRPCLRAIRELGFAMVDTAAPWNLHESAPGRFDFIGSGSGGSSRGQLDLGAFLDACAEEGLLVVLRVGPQVGGELDAAGLPTRIVRDPSMQARSARDTPVVSLTPPRGYAHVSYASRRFLDEVRAWYRALAEVVAPRLHPRGPVVAIAVDHEQGGFLRGGPFCADYHPEALAAWREFSGGLEPPRRFTATRFEDLALPLRWLGFREAQSVGALRTLGAMLDEAGLAGVPRLHGHSPVGPALCDVSASEGVVDVAGLHFHHDRRRLPSLRERARYLLGSSRMPLAVQLAMGTFPWGPALSDEDTREELLWALGSGVVGYSACMAVSRDRWIGAPIDGEGRPRPPLAALITRLHRTLDEAGFTSLTHDVPIGLLMPRAYLRLDLATSHLGPLGPAIAELFDAGEALARESTFGFDGPVQREQATFRTALLDSLRRTHLGHALVDGSAAAERLARYPLLVVPTFDFIERELGGKLARYVAAGGRLLYGPRVPKLDERFAPFDPALGGDMLAASDLADPALLDERLRRFAAEADVTAAVFAPQPEVQTSLHVGAGGAPRLLFVGNTASRPVTAEVQLAAGARSATDALDGATFDGESLTVPLGPHAMRLLVLS